MVKDTGAIRQLGPGEMPGEREIPLSADEARRLKELPPWERMKELRRLRKEKRSVMKPKLRIYGFEKVQIRTERTNAEITRAKRYAEAKRWRRAQRNILTGAGKARRLVAPVKGLYLPKGSG